MKLKDIDKSYRYVTSVDNLLKYRGSIFLIIIIIIIFIIFLNSQQFLLTVPCVQQLSENKLSTEDEFGIKINKNIFLNTAYVCGKIFKNLVT